MQLVIGTLGAPSVVCAGTSNPNYLAFINTGVTSPGSGSPFVVFVDPYASPLPALASFGYRRDFRDLTGHTVLWLPPPPTIVIP
jgi:hypothetical protein